MLDNATRSESGPSHPLASLTSVPDLTHKIVQSDNQHRAAGAFGDVFQCQLVSDGDDAKKVAVKAFRFSFSVDEDDEDGGKAARMIRRELGIWRLLDHPNIVPFLGITYGFGMQGNVSLVSTWMSHGTLHAFLKKHGNQLAVAHRLQLLLDIANGLEYLHSFPVVHGDLTCNNVLLDHDCKARLTDFGCASLVGELPEGFTELVMSATRIGTLRWAAPEHILPDEEEAEHTTKSDIYSFGHVALFTMSGNYPWSEVRNDAAVVLKLSRGLKPGRPISPPIDDLHWALIERCWSSVQERPLAKELISSLRDLGVVNLPSTVELAEPFLISQFPRSHLPGSRSASTDELEIASERSLTRSRRRARPLPQPPDPRRALMATMDELEIGLSWNSAVAAPPWGRTFGEEVSLRTTLHLTSQNPESRARWANSTSWFGAFSGTFPKLSGQGSTKFQIYVPVAGFFTMVMLTDTRPVIYTDPWPKHLTLRFCNEPVKSNMVLLLWLYRRHSWMRVMRFRPLLHPPGKEMNGQRFQALHRFMTEHRIFAYAGWQQSTGKFSYNIFIFPMSSGLAGAVFPDGLPDLPGNGNVLDIPPPRGSEASTTQDEIALPPEFIARLRQENQQTPVVAGQPLALVLPQSA